MAKTKRSLKLSYYNELLNEAKLNFVEKNGSSRGYKNDPEYKRILKNKKKWIYRNDKKRQKDESKEITIENKGKKLKLKIIVLAQKAPFHTVLSYGSKISRAVQSSFRKYKKIGLKRKKRVVLEVIQLKDKTPRLYESEFKADTALKNLYAECVEEQDKEDAGSDEIVVDSIKGEGKTTIFIKVEAYRIKA